MDIKLIKKFCKKNNIDSYIINDDLSIDVFKSVHIKNQISELPIKFNYVQGDFFIRYCQLKTLKNMPNVISGGLYCEYNNLTSLEYMPLEIGGQFNCSYNKIKSIKNKSIVKGSFIAISNEISELSHIENNNFKYLNLKLNKINDISKYKFDLDKLYVDNKELLLRRMKIKKFIHS